jgi:hypothetical protein
VKKQSIFPLKPLPEESKCRRGLPNLRLVVLPLVSEHKHRTVQNLDTGPSARYAIPQKGRTECSAKLESKISTSASAYIRALACGYAKPMRLERLMFMLQGYADDSGSDSLRALYFFGGFLMEAERWSAFADAWQTQLSRSPSIEYIKMEEAHGHSGEFASFAFRGIELSCLWCN